MTRQGQAILQAVPPCLSGRGGLGGEDVCGKGSWGAGWTAVGPWGGWSGTEPHRWALATVTPPRPSPGYDLILLLDEDEHHHHKCEKQGISASHPQAVHEVPALLGQGQGRLHELPVSHSCSALGLQVGDTLILGAGQERGMGSQDTSTGPAKGPVLCLQTDQAPKPLQVFPFPHRFLSCPPDERHPCMPRQEGSSQ